MNFQNKSVKLRHQQEAVKDGKYIVVLEDKDIKKLTKLKIDNKETEIDQFLEEKFSVSVDEGLLKWLDAQIKTKRFASRSHGIEFALNKLKEE